MNNFEVFIFSNPNSSFNMNNSELSMFFARKNRPSPKKAGAAPKIGAAPVYSHL